MGREGLSSLVPGDFYLSYGTCWSSHTTPDFRWVYTDILVVVGAKGGHKFWASWEYPKIGDFTVRKGNALTHPHTSTRSVPFSQSYATRSSCFSFVYTADIYLASVSVRLGPDRHDSYLPEVPMFSIETDTSSQIRAFTLWNTMSRSRRPLNNNSEEAAEEKKEEKKK